MITTRSSLFLIILSLLSLNVLYANTRHEQSSDEAVKHNHHEMHEVKHNNNDTLKVVTWNVEHLAFPIENGCRPRSADEISALREYAENLDADIIGLQEVASEQAIRLLFPEDEWRVIMSERPDSEAYECRESGYTSSQQKVAFVVRNSVKLVANTSYEEFSLDRKGLRYGLSITVETNLGVTDILNLHLKSGCFVDDYQRRDSESCQTFAKQLPVLLNWITQRESSGKPYLVIGDMNHRISAPYNRLTRDLHSAAPSLYIVTRDLIGCHPWYPALIDHIIVGNADHHRIKMSAKVYDFVNMEQDKMLSDHCAISAEI